MREENRDLIVAIALSVAILLGWQYFFAGPQAEKQRLASQQQQSTQANPTAPNPPPSPSQAGGAAPTVPGTVPYAREQTPTGNPLHHPPGATYRMNHCTTNHLRSPITMLWQTTKRSPRPSPRGLACLYIAVGRPATGMFGPEDNQSTTGRWRG